MTIVVAHLDRRSESPVTILIANFVAGPVKARLDWQRAIAGLEPEQCSVVHFRRCDYLAGIHQPLWIECTF